MISKSKIDKIGNSLKKEEELNQEDFNSLLKWRNSFTPTLEYYFQKLPQLLENCNLIILAKRLKRIESIQIKLTRFQTMRLSTIQDIAGIRLVFKNENDLDQAFSKLRSISTRNKLKKVNNYHSLPKEDGYRGMHLIYENSQSQMTEIQLRTELEHVWATAVEVYGELQNTSFKTGAGDDRWKEFFRLLSALFAIKENCLPSKEYETLSKTKIESKLRRAIKDLKVIERLNASSNGINVVSSKFNENGRAGKYAILELDLANKKTIVEIFSKKDYSKAVEIYTQRELSIKKDKKRNIVLVNIESIEKLKRSYPNYFMNTQKLLEILSKIILREDF